MEGKESKLTDIVLANPAYKKIIMDNMKSDKSLVGLIFEIDGKKYQISDGNIDEITNRVQLWKQKNIF